MDQNMRTKASEYVSNFLNKYKGRWAGDKEEDKNKQETCEERVDGSMAGRLQDIRELLDNERRGETDEEIGDLNEYGLCFYYVTGDEHDGEAFWKWQLSTGGPGTEFRFFASGPEDPLYRCEFHHLDWFDHAWRRLDGKNLELMKEIWQWFMEIGASVNEWNKTRGIDRDQHNDW
jgi:hypothetical protein